MIIYTVGHSNRSIDDFLLLLREHGIKTVVDVRKIAKSRHNPQFEEIALQKSLLENGIEYLRMEGLGGFRGTAKSTVNEGWYNASFRAYADYMQTPEFTSSINKLVEISQKEQIVIMCAEAVPWRCHRSLIGDALLVRGIEVQDIMSEKASRPHVLTKFAKVEGDEITYPAEG